MANTVTIRPKQDHGEGSYKGSDKLKGKVAFITGAQNGIGKAVAIAFAREGADIAFTYLDSKAEVEDASDTVRIIEDEGRKALAVAGDVRDEKFVARFVEQAMEEFGDVDILVNNAAFKAAYDGIETVPSDEFDRAFKTNVYGPFFMTRALFPRMRSGSAIINTVSIQAFQPSAVMLPYAATKGALATFTKAFAQEAIKKGIRVNGVASGAQDPESDTAQPADFAPVYVHLASADASHVNGEIWTVTGGALS